VLDAGVLAFVRAALPPPPARLLEVGAGRGELAAALRDAGYEVVAVDPAAGADDAAGVWPVALHEVGEPDASFDGALAVLSLHHVEPLAESCARLGALVRDGGVLVVDEFDVERFDERAARWLSAQRAAAGADHPHDRAAWVADLRADLHPLAAIRDALAPAFAVGEPVRGAYLYRWDVDPALRAVEEGLIARGELPATGARLVATRAGTGRSGSS
jgi:SAM-dependent methyltransferase